MHGTVLSRFRDYVLKTSGEAGWLAIVKAAGVPSSIYVPTQLYPDSEATALFAAAAKFEGKTSKELQETFGEYLAPLFVQIYGAMMPAEWTALDIAENSAMLVHRVVKMRNRDARPPKWSVSRMAPHRVRVEYFSGSGMCGLFMGVMRGFAAGRGHPMLVDEPHCRHRGEEACVILLSMPEGAR